MSIATIYTLAEVQATTGANRNLITFLVRDRQIPVKAVGNAKVVDDAGFKKLVKAIDEYNAKPDGERNGERNDNAPPSRRRPTQAAGA